ncbi:MAG: helix-turn-helix transcriptional regulator [Actinomycetota bacterium]
MSGSEMVPAAVAASTMIHPRSGQGLTDTLVEQLGECRLLLVLDNCEHVVAACAALVSKLLQACPHLTVLATSREPLAVEGETTSQVPPLPVPDPGARSAGEISTAHSARLFEVRARQVLPVFRLTDDNSQAVAEICRRLDGIPLAIELAAARVRVLTPAQIVAGLENRFRLLSRELRDVPARHRTLEASLEWSYGLLGDAERLALARLSVFAGEFDLDAAEAVVEGDGVPAPDVLELLTSLSDRSLLQVRELGGHARYRLLETIRLYARQRLEELDDPARVRDRHLDFYRDLAARARAGLASQQPEVWIERLAGDLDDMCSAMDWAVESHRPLFMMDIAEPTFAFWLDRGLYPEMLRRLSAAIESPAAGGAERARGLTTASILALVGGDNAAGHAFAVRAVSQARAVSAGAPLVRALTYVSWSGFHVGNVGSDEIQETCEDALALAEKQDHKTEARALVLSGQLALYGRTLATGRHLLERAVSLCEASGLTHQLASAHAFLGLWPAFSGELEQARQHAWRALELSQRFERRGFESYALTGLALADLLQGDEQGARQRLAQAQATLRFPGLATFELIVSRWAAVTEYRFGDLSTARETAAKALRIAREHGSRWDEAAGEWLLGVLALRERRHADAQRHLQQSREMSVDPRYPFSLGRSLLGLAYLAQVDGDDLDEAWELAHTGLEVLAEHGDRPGTADALEAVAGLAAFFDRPQQALRLLAAADRFHVDTGIGRLPLEAELSEIRRADACAQLTADEADACWADGRALPIDEAVGYARRGRGDRGRPRIGWESLTPTEREILDLVADGCSNAEIGKRLFITVNTVKTHLSRIYAKVAVEGRAELAAQAARRKS